MLLGVPYQIYLVLVYILLFKQLQTDGHDDSDSDDLDNDNSTGGDNVKGNTSG